MFEIIEYSFCNFLESLDKVKDKKRRLKKVSYNDRISPIFLKAHNIETNWNGQSRLKSTLKILFKNSNMVKK